MGTHDLAQPKLENMSSLDLCLTMTRQARRDNGHDRQTGGCGDTVNT